MADFFFLIFYLNRCLDRRRSCSCTRRSTCASPSRTNARSAPSRSPIRRTCRSTPASTWASNPTAVRSANANSRNYLTFSSTWERTRGTNRTDAAILTAPRPSANWVTSSLIRDRTRRINRTNAIPATSASRMRRHCSSTYPSTKNPSISRRTFATIAVNRTRKRRTWPNTCRNTKGEGVVVVPVHQRGGEQLLPLLQFLQNNKSNNNNSSSNNSNKRQKRQLWRPTASTNSNNNNRTVETNRPLLLFKVLRRLLSPYRPLDPISLTIHWQRSLRVTNRAEVSNSRVLSFKWRRLTRPLLTTSYCHCIRSNRTTNHRLITTIRTRQCIRIITWPPLQPLLRPTILLLSSPATRTSNDQQGEKHRTHTHKLLIVQNTNNSKTSQDFSLFKNRWHRSRRQMTPHFCIERIISDKLISCLFLLLLLIIIFE